jgi:hypothetical protein
MAPPRATLAGGAWTVKWVCSARRVEQRSLRLDLRFLKTYSLGKELAGTLRPPRALSALAPSGREIVPAVAKRNARIMFPFC